MKYKIDDKVLNIATGKECIIIGTKDKPYKPKINPYNHKEIFPENGMEYLLMIKKSENEYLGIMSAMESHLKKLE